MKKIVPLLIVILSILSCSEENRLPDYTGKTGELIVVIENKFLETKSGSAVEDVFKDFTPGLPQEEPLFTVVTIPASGFNKILQRHRNILIADINPANTTSNISLETNKWAKNQLYVRISAPNDSVFANIILKNRETLVQYFQEKELERLKVGISKNVNKELSERVGSKFGNSLKVPAGYQLLLDTTDFIWIRFETEKPQGGQMHPVNRNILIYSQPYISENMFAPEQMVASQDSITRLYIHGQKDGSFMRVYDEYPVHEKSLNLNNNYAKEIRGLWHLYGDFMGGPFITYSYANNTTNQMITVVSFLYAPQFDKREYLREMEAIMRTFQ
jgi:hypothetical protein